MRLPSTEARACRGPVAGLAGAREGAGDARVLFRTPNFPAEAACGASAQRRADAVPRLWTVQDTMTSEGRDNLAALQARVEALAQALERAHGPLPAEKLVDLTPALIKAGLHVRDAALDPGGKFALPTRLYGARLGAPCAGVVLAAVVALSDQPPGAPAITYLSVLLADGQFAYGRLEVSLAGVLEEARGLAHTASPGACPKPAHD